jgi:thymidylate kinase
MYFAIEGIKGSGKSAIFEGVIAALKEHWLDVHVLRPTARCNVPLLDPLYETFGHHWPDVLVERLYAFRSNRAARSMPKRDCLVVGERSVLTSYVSRWDASDPLAGLAHVDALEHRIELPQHVIFLSVPITLAMRRIGSRPKRGYGTRDETEHRLREADSLYRHLAHAGAHYGLGQIRWHWINAAQPLDNVIRDVVGVIVDFEPRPAAPAAIPLPRKAPISTNSFNPIFSRKHL